MRPTCVFCADGGGKAGKLLKCLHKICFDCLPGSVEKDGRIRCAKCRRTTPCPPPGRRHEQLLVDDSMFDSVPNKSTGTKQSDAKDHDLQIVLDDRMNSPEVQPESRSADVDRSTVARADNQTPHHGRVYFCPCHGKMEMRYYCTLCREVLCECCRVDVKHESHIDQIKDATDVAAALRHRLMKRLRNIVPDDKDQEAEESLQYAGDLLEAFESDVASQVSNIKTQISEKCEEQLLKVKKRKKELESEAKTRKKELAEQEEYYRKSNSAERAFQHIQDGLRYAIRNEDLLKMYPRSINHLTAASRDMDAKRSELMRRVVFACQNLEAGFGEMGNVVDNTDIDLSMCAFAEDSPYLAFVGDELGFGAKVRNGRGQLVSALALKVSSFQIWATELCCGCSSTAPELVPVLGYSKGHVHALFQYDCREPATYLLELLLDTPCPLPELQKQSTVSDVAKYFPLKTWLLVYKSQASFFHSSQVSPTQGIALSYSSTWLPYLSQAPPCIKLRQVENEVATARAMMPIQDRDFSVGFIIFKCPSSKIDIGFSWECAETSQEMNIVLASSPKSHSSLSPICDFATADIVHVNRRPHAHGKYDIDHYSWEGVLKNEHHVTVHPNKKPILMVRMFHSGAIVKVFEDNKKQLKERIQALIRTAEAVRPDQLMEQ
ncbi:uncharacterized protein LOC135825866 [Sycon ciliatum]|uniref:uncharacterized protein LOC135825866 n=1 Tax=Sycon ciliatum TaxID=27933 RepID=UPI0031F65A26